MTSTPAESQTVKVLDYSRALVEADVNQQTINKIAAKRATQHEQHSTELRAIRVEYFDLEEQLRHRKEDAVSAVESKREGEAKAASDEITKLEEPIRLVKRVLLFKKVQKEGNNPVGHPTIHAYNDRELSVIGSLSDTSTLVLDVVLAENDKPKNKYSLVIVGNSAFRSILEPPHYYGAPFNTFGERCDIESGIRDFPTKEELQAWFAKNKMKILADYIKSHTETEAEYLIVAANCNTPEWEKAYWKDRKDYYENHYSHGTEQPEYAVVCSELNKLEN